MESTQKTLLEEISDLVEAKCKNIGKSPISEVMKICIEGSVYNVAPEKADSVKEFDNLTYQYTDQAQWRLSVDPQEEKIILSKGAMELLWCSALAHYIYYTTFFSGKTYNRTIGVDPCSDVRAGQSLGLFLWVINLHKQKNGELRWPENLPCPKEFSDYGSDEHIADEVSLVSWGFLLHHELAHIRLRHSPNVDDEISIQQENEADIAAAEWVFSSIQENDICFTKRLVGVVNAYMTTVILDLYASEIKAGRHPFSFNRLSSFLDRISADSDGIGYAVAFSILSFHYQYSGRVLELGEYDNFKKPLEALCNQLAEEFRSEGS